MAEPGEPRTPEDDFDDQVGFCSPQSVAGRPVEPEPAPEPVAHPAPGAGAGAPDGGRRARTRTADTRA